MAFLEIDRVAIKGLSACVPKRTDYISDIYKWEGVESFIEATGVKERRHAETNVTTADMCYHAADTLINELGWERNEIDAVILVTQTPEYYLPATACILQNRLNLSTDCYALDISLGCSGWVYALSVIASLMQNGYIKKGLLLAGETAVISSGENDKSAYPLFGDAGTATALEYDAEASGFKFAFNTDGTGFETIIIRDGGYRHPFNSKSREEIDHGNDIIRDRMHVELDGMNIFSFGITKAPKQVKQLLEHFNIDKDKVNLFTFHQANLMMNEMIRKKLKLPEEKVPYCISKFGNTSSASIPLTLVSEERSLLCNGKLQHVACGFGVGLSWGSVWFETDKIIVPQIKEI